MQNFHLLIDQALNSYDELCLEGYVQTNLNMLTLSTRILARRRRPCFRVSRIAGLMRRSFSFSFSSLPTSFVGQFFAEWKSVCLEVEGEVETFLLAK